MYGSPHVFGQTITLMHFDAGCRRRPPHQASRSEPRAPLLCKGQALGMPLSSASGEGGDVPVPRCERGSTNGTANGRYRYGQATQEAITERRVVAELFRSTLRLIKAASEDVGGS